MGLWPQPREGTYPAVLIAVEPGADADHQEKCLSQLYDHMPEGLTPLATLKNAHQRRQLGACWRPSSLPARAPFDAQLVLLMDSPRQAPGEGLESRGPESRWPLWIQKSEGVVLEPQWASGAVCSRLLRGPRPPMVKLEL